jgi:hypothetical protein
MRRRPAPTSLAVAALLLGCDAPPSPPSPTPTNTTANTTATANTNATANANANAAARPNVPAGSLGALETIDAKSAALEGAAARGSAGAAVGADGANAGAAIDPRIAAALAEAAVTDTAFARRTLWSWTTVEQTQTLRREKKILLPTELPDGPTPYVELLEKIAQGTGAYADLARLLAGHPSLRLRRYAWTRPWPTKRGLADRDYGDQLVRVVLSPRAVIARFDPSRPDVFELHDMDERPVPIGEIVANPSRLAAVLHVRTNDTPVAHREYVLCNESMIAEWSLATDEVRAAVAADRALAKDLAAASLAAEPAAPRWRGSPSGSALFGASLAFDNDRYRATPANMNALEVALASAEQRGAPLTVTPTTQFAFDAAVPRVSVRRVAPRVARVV